MSAKPFRVPSEGLPVPRVPIRVIRAVFVFPYPQTRGAGSPVPSRPPRQALANAYICSEQIYAPSKYTPAPGALKGVSVGCEPSACRSASPRAYGVFQVGDVRDPQGSSEAELGPKRRQRPIAQMPWGTLQGDCGGACLSCVAASLFHTKIHSPQRPCFLV